tara:strand:- start:733 stop:1065 length:333 start_codon:yes stop_codon:yes gene_type:complete
MNQFYTMSQNRRLLSLRKCHNSLKGVLDATDDFFIEAKLTLWSTAATGATLGVSLWNRRGCTIERNGVQEAQQRRTVSGPHHNRVHMQRAPQREVRLLFVRYLECAPKAT